MTGNKPIKFGTDGWRGIIAEDFTFDNVRLCSQAVAKYLKDSGLAQKGLVIGYDTRFASEYFAIAAAEVICGNGIKVYLCDETTPTPVVSYGVIAKEAGGGIVITASHNPAQWNGLKYKSSDGASAPTEVIAELEKNITAITEKGKISRILLPEARKRGLLEGIDPAPIYMEQIKKLVDLDVLRKAGLKIAVDSMYGAGIGYFKMLLGGDTTSVIEINGERNPAFPGMKQPEPVAINLDGLSEKVREEKTDVGIATDGDSDRIGIMDENGSFLTQLQVFALIALYLLEVRGERGAIVKTITRTNMLYRLGEIFDVPVYETPVGFKYIAPIMLERDALVGGEESGGYGYRGHVPERDAILSGLYFLDFMTKTGKTPSQLLDYLYSKVGPHHYSRVDVEFAEEQKGQIISRVQDSSPKMLGGVKVVEKSTLDGFRFTLKDSSWLLIRFSGTEPLLRIYSESDSKQRAGELLELGKDIAGV
ncbi:MAG TPA: phosphoglucomutase/phosphomannomutase family protein [Dehalococcoidia bacterium]|nr:phosphoglucomutase/phosphomannomutase family protein [Dehalococcoidia bacterium]